MHDCDCVWCARVVILARGSVSCRACGDGVSRSGCRTNDDMATYADPHRDLENSPPTMWEKMPLHGAGIGGGLPPKPMKRNSVRGVPARVVAVCCRPDAPSPCLYVVVVTRERTHGPQRCVVRARLRSEFRAALKSRACWCAGGREAAGSHEGHGGQVVVRHRAPPAWPHWQAVSRAVRRVRARMSACRRRHRVLCVRV